MGQENCCSARNKPIEIEIPADLIERRIDGQNEPEPGALLLKEGLISVMDHQPSPKISQQLRAQVELFSSQDKSIPNAERLVSDWKIEVNDDKIHWKMPYGSEFKKDKLNDLDRILKWYEKNCPKRTIHINTGIAQFDNFNTESAIENIKDDIEYACKSQVRCSVYVCRVTGSSRGPRYDWDCDYIDAWSNSAVYDSEFLDDEGKVKNTFEV